MTQKEWDGGYRGSRGRVVPRKKGTRRNVLGRLCVVCVCAELCVVGLVSRERVFAGGSGKSEEGSAATLDEKLSIDIFVRSSWGNGVFYVGEPLDVVVGVRNTSDEKILAPWPMEETGNEGFGFLGVKLDYETVTGSEVINVMGRAWAFGGIVPSVACLRCLHPGAAVEARRQLIPLHAGSAVVEAAYMNRGKCAWHLVKEHYEGGIEEMARIEVEYPAMWQGHVRGSVRLQVQNERGPESRDLTEELVRRISDSNEQHSVRVNLIRELVAQGHDLAARDLFAILKKVTSEKEGAVMLLECVTGLDKLLCVNRVGLQLTAALCAVSGDAAVPVSIRIRLLQIVKKVIQRRRENVCTIGTAQGLYRFSDETIQNMKENLSALVQGSDNERVKEAAESILSRLGRAERTRK